MDVIVSGTKAAVTMIEGFAREVSEDDMFAAIEFAHDTIKEVIELQEELYSKVNPQKDEFTAPEPDGLLEKLKGSHYDKLKEVLQIKGKHDRGAARKELRESVVAELIPNPDADGAIEMGAFKTAWHDLEERVIRDMLLAGVRTDGRAMDELRDIECHVNILPRVHGLSLIHI